jgi:hypothetical protein
MRFGSDAPVASVLVGLVDPRDSIDHLLAALAEQSGSIPFEVVIASRCGPEVGAALRSRHPGVVVHQAEPRTTLPDLRLLALRRSRGRYVFVTEDHTVPPRDWIESFVRVLEAAPPRVAAVGGLVDNAMRECATDWAAFLGEYHAYLPPRAGGETTDVPGMNVAYRREVLESADPGRLAEGFWETTLHPRLLQRGGTFLLLPEVVIAHRKRSPFAYSLAQRFHYSRYYAGRRFARTERLRRAAFALGSILLPPLVVGRVARSVAERPAYRAALLRSFPALCCFSLAWWVGECAGYLFGPGDSLARIE